MATKLSAGLLLYRFAARGAVEVMCVHMGGPYWVRKDEGAWSIPKGEYVHGEDPAAVAKREFLEEIGVEPPEGPWLGLGEVRQPGGKVVSAWAVEHDLDVSQIQSNTFELEWPKGSGKVQAFPEVDRAEWFDLPTARRKLVKGQVRFLDLLMERLRERGHAVMDAPMPQAAPTMGDHALRRDGSGE
jgi:predicted NUDIX family NTP pyrophosphohydrolase